METEEEKEIARQARAIEVLERLGDNEDRNRGAQARQALNGFVRQRVQQGARFSRQFIEGIGPALDLAVEGFVNDVGPAASRVGEALDSINPRNAITGLISALDDPVAGPALANAASPVREEVGAVADTLQGFFNPDSALAPEVRAQLDELSASDPLATDPVDQIAALSGSPQSQTTAPAQQAAPVTQGVRPSVVPSNSPTTSDLLNQLTQQQLALGNQANAAELAQIQNAVAVDEFTRAQTASQLVSAPQLQFSQAQQLGNAALAGQGVQPSILNSVAALQQLNPSANIQSVQPAINASADQSRSVNSQEQAANRANTRTIREAQELAALKRQAFIDNVVIPRLGQGRQ